MREAVIDIVSGSVAGMVSTAVGHPFDTLKDLDSTENSLRFGLGWRKMLNQKKDAYANISW